MRVHACVYRKNSPILKGSIRLKVEIELLFDLNQQHKQCTTHTHTHEKKNNNSNNDEKTENGRAKKKHVAHTKCKRIPSMLFKSAQHQISYLLLKCIHARKRISSHIKWKAANKRRWIERERKKDREIDRWIDR